MAIKDIFKVSRKTFFDPAAWFGDTLQVNTQIIWSLVRRLFQQDETPVVPETFEEALVKQNLTDEMAQKTGRRFFYFSLFFVLCGLLTWAYGIYLMVDVGTLAGLMLAIVSGALFFSQAFRFHFWHFQIKNRKLGCTFEEWWQGKTNK